MNVGELMIHRWGGRLNAFWQLRKVDPAKILVVQCSFLGRVGSSVDVHLLCLLERSLLSRNIRTYVCFSSHKSFTRAFVAGDGQRC